MAVATPTAKRPAAKASSKREDPHAALEVSAMELRERFTGRVDIEPATRPEGSSKALTVRLDGGDFATFGVIDATYYWTFDGGESCHYAKDKEVMKRFISFELNAAIARADRNT